MHNRLSRKRVKVQAEQESAHWEGIREHLITGQNIRVQQHFVLFYDEDRQKCTTGRRSREELIEDRINRFYADRTWPKKVPDFNNSTAPKK
jgi:hypothetical protein